MVHGIGLPPILNWGTEAMQAEIAPPILRGEKWISLGISEPGGGSDVANLSTTAVRDGDHYIVTGSKTYITGGMRANWVSTAVRTGEAGAKGVSMLLDSHRCRGVFSHAIGSQDGLVGVGHRHALF